MIHYLRAWILAFLFGLCGVGVGMIAKHLWQDHLALHELAQIELIRIQQSKQAPASVAPGK